MSADIPFNRPGLVGRELEYMQAAVRGGHSSASGPYTEKASEILSTAHDGAHVLLTTSCTDALEMSALLLDIRPGDLVIVPSFTFVSTALAFTRAGARILFADIEPVTLGIDPRHVAELLDAHPGVRAVVTVHYAGVAGEIEALQDAGIAPLESHPAEGYFAHEHEGHLSRAIIVSIVPSWSS